MLKKNSWLIEVVLITCSFGLILSGITYTVLHNYIDFVTGFAINVVACLLFFLFAIIKLNKFVQKEKRSFLNLFKNKLLFKDVWIVLLVFIVGKLTYHLIMKIEFVHFFGINAMKQNSSLTNLQGWLMVSLLILFIPIVAFSEELYFRAYLFERQYPQFGKYTWIVNGLSWSIYHLFTTTNFLALLPSCLMYSYAYQKRRNIWVTIVMHLIWLFFAFYPFIKNYIPN